MTAISRFIVIPASPAPQVDGTTVPPGGGFTLPGPTGSDIRQFALISAPDFDERSWAILAFRVNPKGTNEITLGVRINGTEVLRQIFNTNPQRSWHEIIRPGVLRATENTLTMSAWSPASGSIDVSDVFLLYQARVL